MTMEFSPATTTLLDANIDTDAHAIRQEILQRIEILNLEINTLRTRHNVASPICRLPPETLCEIFLTLADSMEDQREWVKVTWICERWRSVALACTTLWTNIPIINPMFTEGIIARSKAAPISFNVTSPDQTGVGMGWKPILKTLFPRESGRLSSLILECEGPQEHAFLQSTLPKIPPTTSLGALKDLIVRSNPSNADIIPHGFLHRGMAPALDSLTLEHCGALWSDIPFSTSLTCLVLEGSLTRNTHLPPSLNEFLNAMKAMPLLNCLVLRGYLPRVRRFSPAPAMLKRAPCQFAELDQLYIDDSAATIDHFLQVIRLPCATEIILYCTDRIVDPRDAGKVLSRLKKIWFDREDDWRPMECGVKSLDTSEIIFGGKHSEGRRIDFTLDAPIDLDENVAEYCPTLTLALNCASTNSYKTLHQELSKVVDFTPISGLSIRHHPSKTVPDWAALFSDHAKVETVELDGYRVCATS